MWTKNWKEGYPGEVLGHWAQSQKLRGQLCNLDPSPVIFCFVFDVSLDILDTKCQKTQDPYGWMHSLKTFKKLQLISSSFKCFLIGHSCMLSNIHADICMSAWMRAPSSLLNIYNQYQCLLRVCDSNLLVVCAPNHESDVCTWQISASLLQFIKYNCKDHLDEALKSPVHSRIEPV